LLAKVLARQPPSRRKQLYTWNICSRAKEDRNEETHQQYTGKNDKRRGRQKRSDVKKIAKAVQIACCCPQEIKSIYAASARAVVKGHIHKATRLEETSIAPDTDIGHLGSPTNASRHEMIDRE